MCNPLLISLGLGAAQAATGIQEQNTQHSMAVAQVNRSNAMAKNKWINDLQIASVKDQERGRVYEAQLKADAKARTAYNRQLQINAESAGYAKVAEELKLNEKITKAMFESQANVIKSIKDRGSLLASDMGRGGSLLSELTQVERELGFEQAQIDATLYDATRAFGVASFGIDLDQYGANTTAYNALPTKPVAPTASFAPVEPIKMSAPPKPSVLGPILGGISTGLSTGTALGGSDYWTKGDWTKDIPGYKA